MPTIYPPLTIGARARLAMFKREASQPNWARPMTWRDVRFAKLTSHTGLDQGFDGEGRACTPVWYTHDGAEFRNERFCDEVEGTRIGHRGWFTDDCEDETVRGIVASLPHGRFIAGYLLSMNDERVYFPEVHTDESDAARMADEHARVIAESERDYQASERERMAQEDAESAEQD